MVYRGDRNKFKPLTFPYSIWNVWNVRLPCTQSYIITSPLFTLFLAPCLLLQSVLDLWDCTPSNSASYSATLFPSFRLPCLSLCVVLGWTSDPSWAKENLPRSFGPGAHFRILLFPGGEWTVDITFGSGWRSCLESQRKEKEWCWSVQATRAGWCSECAWFPCSWGPAANTCHECSLGVWCPLNSEWRASTSPFMLWI